MLEVLQSHHQARGFGRTTVIRAVQVAKSLEVVLRFGGGCHGCGMVDVTLKEGIETSLKMNFPEIRGILDATDHSTGENPYYK